ncbi:MAG TPA: hypothetical protein VFP98_03020, partial [Candidatus Polarisedimenticolia bacterium]|nr:hypothetical protein [Candidatus Polarisedimenticolia bacterium]
LLLGREDQINYVTYSERMFRSDGSMRIFNSNGTAPNPLCMDSPNPPIWTPGSPGGGCPNPNVTPWTQSTRVQCTAASIPGDFDGDGNQGGQGGPDICFNKAIYNSQPQLDPGRGDFVVQGGTIDLTGFAVAVGLRIHF